MEKMVAIFADEVKKNGFLTEWSLYVEQGLPAEVMATSFLEQLRNTEDKPR